MAPFDTKKEERRERFRILAGVLLFIFLLTFGVFLFAVGYVNAKLLEGNPQMAAQWAAWIAACFVGLFISIGTTIYGIVTALDY